jgi:maltose O-acetyltransferase
MATTIASALPQLTFNHTRTMILRAAGLKIGPRSLVMGPLRLTGDGEPSDLLTIGSDSVVTGPLQIDFGAPVEIGDHVYIGHDVLLLTVDHDIGPTEQRCGPHLRLSIKVGSGTWIGSRVTVLPGVQIGEGAVIAAGATVVRDVEPNTLVGGVPARLIRELEPGMPVSRQQRRPRSVHPGESG